MQPFDEPLFRAINGLAGRSVILDAIGIFSARYIIFFLASVPFVMLALRWWPTSERVHAQRAFYRVVLAGTFAIIGNALIALSFFRVRPFAALDRVTLLIDAPLTPKSFPSDHATMAFVLAMSIFFAWPRLGRVLLVAAVFVAFGRVFVGVHYPIDVLTGAIVGSFWAWSVRKITDRHRYHSNEPE